MTIQPSPTSSENAVIAQTLDHNKQKLSRTSTHKVRTGCITCKKRHVKCDEAKPQCGNCLKSRGHCEGYVEKPKKQRTGPDQVRWDSRQLTRPAPPRTQLKLDLDALDFRDSQSLLYFQEFVDLVQGPWIATGSSGGLWDVALPQLSRNNTTLRYAAVGIGALSMWYRQSRHKTLSKAVAPVYAVTEADTHYFRGVASYSHALKLLSQHASIQDAVFLSVLSLCFETLRGHRKAALDHINHGLALLLAILTDQDTCRHVAALAPNPKPLLGTVVDIFTHLLNQARLVFRGSSATGPPLPNFTRGLRHRKQSFESFIILISQLSTRSTAADQVPAVFSSLDEFEEYWVVAQRERTAIGPLIMDVIRTSEILSSADQTGINKFWLLLTGDPRIKAFYEVSDKEMETLDAAFLPLFNQVIMSDSKSSAYLRAIHLRLQYLACQAFENPMHYHNLETLQAKTPLFREYLSLADMALHIAKRDIKNPAQQLSLQCGLSWRLLLVAFFCRDPLVRDRAAWMLKDYPGEDGLWTTRSLYILAQKSNTIERINATEGTPTEQWHRLWRREYLFEEGGDRAVFCYLARNEETGQWELVEETAGVLGGSEEVIWVRRPLTGAGKLLLGDAIFL
ncbi:Fc.00g072950.m01.CDS01 [Cosmosporella sp. VM-42]